MRTHYQNNWDTYYQEGQLAYKEQIKRENNPYQIISYAAKQWEKGWFDEQCHNLPTAP